MTTSATCSNSSGIRYANRKIFKPYTKIIQIYCIHQENIDPEFSYKLTCLTSFPPKLTPASTINGCPSNTWVLQSDSSSKCVQFCTNFGVLIHISFGVLGMKITLQYKLQPCQGAVPLLYPSEGCTLLQD